MRFFKYIFLSSFVFSYELSGYLEMNIDAFSKQNFYYLGYNKIRCNVLNEINDDILFEASLIGKNNYGKKTFILNDYLPYTEDGYFEGFDPMNINDSVYFDYLYFIYLNCFNRNKNVVFMKQPKFANNNIWLNLIKIKNNKKFNLKKLIKKLLSNKIEVRPVWKCNHLQKPFRYAQKFKIKKAPILVNSYLCLPSSYFLKKKDILKICNLINE